MSKWVHSIVSTPNFQNSKESSLMKSEVYWLLWSMDEDVVEDDNEVTRDQVSDTRLRTQTEKGLVYEK